MTYEELLKHADSTGVIVREKNIPGYGGRIYKNRIAIHKGIETQAEKSCVLAEELGHHFTTYGNILDQSKVMNRKQEFRARIWAYNTKIGLDGIISAFNHGCRSKSEIMEYLDVTDDFLCATIDYFKNKYGQYVIRDKYVIYFEPALMIGEFYGDLKPEWHVFHDLCMEISEELCP